MNNSTEQEQEVVLPSKVNFIFYNVDRESAMMGQDIIRQYGKNGAAAFQALLEAYLSQKNFAQLLMKIEELEQRLQQLEEQPIGKVKTFGGHTIG